MNSKASRLARVSARLIAMAAVAVLSWQILPDLAGWLHEPLLASVHIAIATGSGLASWFVFWRLFDFCDDCMCVPHKARLAHPVTKAGTGESCPVRVPASELGELISTPRLTITSSPNPDGTLTFVVIATGFSARAFTGVNGLRHRLHSMPGIVWQNPESLPGGRRRITGSLVASMNRQEAIARLVRIAQRSS